MCSKHFLQSYRVIWLVGQAQGQAQNMALHAPIPELLVYSLRPSSATYLNLLSLYFLIHLGGYPDGSYSPIYTRTR